MPSRSFPIVDLSRMQARCSLALPLALLLAVATSSAAMAAVTITPTTQQQAQTQLGGAFSQTFNATSDGATPCNGTTSAVTLKSGSSLPTGVTLTGGTNSATVSGTVSSSALVKNYTFTLHYDRGPSGAGQSTNCTNGDSVTYTLPVYYRFPATTFGGATAQPSAVAAGGTNLYIAESASNQVWKIANANTNPPNNHAGDISNISSTFGTLNWPNGLAVSGTNVFTTNFRAADTASLAEGGGTQRTIGLTGCTNPAGVGVDFAATPDVLVACAGSNKVFQVNSSTGAVVGSPVTLPGTSPAPAGVVAVPLTGGRSFLVGDARNDKIYYINATNTGPAIAQFSTIGGNVVATVSNCVPARMVADTPSGAGANKKAWVVCPGNGTVVPLTLETRTDNSGRPSITPGTAISVGSSTSRPFGIAYDTGNSELVASNSGTHASSGAADHSIHVFNTATPASQTIFTLPSNGVANGVALFSNAGGTGISLAYIADQRSGEVWVVDPPAAKKAAKARHRAVRRHRRHRRHRARASAASNIALLRGRAHTDPLNPPLSSEGRG